MSKAYSKPRGGAFKDLTGKTFGRLTVLTQAERSKTGFRRWVCRCQCGKITSPIQGANLQNGHTQSCGCWMVERAISANTSHGFRYHPNYTCWLDMWRRCTDPADKSFHKYKDRCPPDSWRSLEVFIEDAGVRPSPQHSLDRIKNGLPYGPGNVRWATRKEQQQNTSANVNITFQGKTQCRTAWATELGINPETLRYRLNQGWSLERAFNTSVKLVLATKHSQPDNDPLSERKP